MFESASELQVVVFKNKPDVSRDVQTLNVKDLTQLGSDIYLSFKIKLKEDGIQPLILDDMQLYDFALSIDEIT